LGQQGLARATYPQSRDTSPVVYVAAPAAQKVLIVSQAGSHQKAIGELKGFTAPTSLAVDSSGNLYVSDLVATGGQIDVFAPGAQSPTRTLTGVVAPDAIAVDSKADVYSNCLDNSGCTENAVYVFAAGSSTPTATLVDTNLTEIANVAIDGAGDVFVDGDESGFPIRANEIDEFPAGSTSAVVVTKSTIAPTVLAFDAQQNLIVGVSNGDLLQVYAPPYTKPNAKAYRTNCDPTALAFDSADSALWYACAGRAVQLSYPGLKKVEATSDLSRFGLSGLATDPAAPL
jgi:hypothetical protein